MAVSRANVMEAFDWFKDLQDAANEKKFVQKEEGKQLSSNDFSDADKAKLDSLSDFEPATATKLGGIKVGDGLDIQSDGTLSIDYDLPTASATTKGGIKVGTGLSMDRETLNADGYNLPTASTSKKGGIKVGNGLSMDGETLNADGYDLPTASKTRKGGIKVGDGLDMTGDTLSCTVEPGITNLVSQTQNGIMRATDKVKLDGIEDNAQVNTIERIKVDNSALAITNKTVNIDLSGFVKSSDIAGAYHYKGTVNSYANLPTSGQAQGDVYNVRTAGGQDINGDDIKAGDNVAWTGVGWDVLAGTVDLSNFVLKVPGKDLSTEDFTTALKTKLEGLSDYSLPTASATVKGGVKIGTGLQMNGETLNATATNYTLPTASSSIKGGIKVGNGLSITGDTLSVTLQSGTSVIAGTGLSFAGDTLNCTLSGGGGTYNNFTGASANLGGTSGLVPSPAGGDNIKFLRGDGTWATANQNITIISGATTIPPTPHTLDGALWEDSLSNGEPVLKMRYGDYEFNFNYDTKNYTGSTQPFTPEDAQLYILDTVSSTDEGALWYNVTQSTYFPVPALCLHAGNYDYGYNYDTITYKGVKDDLYSYLPLQNNISDAMGKAWVTKLPQPPVFEKFTINGKTYYGFRDQNSNSTSTGAASTAGLQIENLSLSKCTIDFWLSIPSSGSLPSTRYAMFSYVQGTNTPSLFLTNNALTHSVGTTSTILSKTLPSSTGDRLHIAFVMDGTYHYCYVNGVLNGTPYKAAWTPTTLKIYPYTYGTGVTGKVCIDHFRVWNKVVWDGSFTVPDLSSDY